MERYLNIAFIFLALLTLGSAYLLHTTHSEWLVVLKTALEASLVGAIADSYAVYGLFRKIGPHTDLLRKRKKEISEKAVEFVSEFLLSKEHIAREIEKMNLDFVLDAVDKPETKERIKDMLLEIIRKNRESKVLKETLGSVNLPVPGMILNLVKDALEDGVYTYIENSLPKWIDKGIEKLRSDEKLKARADEFIRKSLVKFIEENHKFLVDLIRKRIESVSDEEFVEAVKKASWNELQWIRLNGALLGFIIGLFIGFAELVIK